MRIPPFRNVTVSSSTTRIAQESRTSLVGDSGARNASKRPGQRRGGRPDAHHDSRELTGCRTGEGQADTVVGSGDRVGVGTVMITTGAVSALPSPHHLSDHNWEVAARVRALP